jgi:hypothetical protein
VLQSTLAAELLRSLTRALYKKGNKQAKQRQRQQNCDQDNDSTHACCARLKIKKGSRIKLLLMRKL